MTNRTNQKMDDIMKAYRRVFGTPDGQRVMEHIKTIAGMNQPVFLPNNGQMDSHVAAFRDGRRALCIDLMNLSRPKEEQPEPPKNKCTR